MSRDSVHNTVKLQYSRVPNRPKGGKKWENNIDIGSRATEMCPNIRPSISCYPPKKIYMFDLILWLLPWRRQAIQSKLQRNSKDKRMAICTLCVTSLPGLGWTSLNGRSTSSSPPIQASMSLTLTEYETTTPSKSPGASSFSIRLELAKFVSSFVLLNAPSTARPRLT